MIKKPNANKPPSPDKTRVNLKHQDTNISPNNRVMASKVLNKAQPSDSDKIVLSSKQRESGDKIVPNSGPNATKEVNLSKPNGGPSGDEYSPNNELTSRNYLPLASSAKINTTNGVVASISNKNKNGIVNSKLNPYVNEFIPKSAQVASSQIFKAEEENMNKIHMIDSQNNDTSVTKFEQEVDKSEIAIDGTVVKNEDKEIKNQMAKMLKNQISIKNNTFKEQQQTNRAIVNLLKLYADPKPAKQLKLLTPQFFEKSITTDLKDSECNQIECSIEQKVSIRDVTEAKNDVTPYTQPNNFKRNNNKPDTTIERITSLNDAKEAVDVTSYLRGSIAKTQEAMSMASDNSDKKTNVSSFKKRDIVLKNSYDALARNALVENYDLTFKENTYDKENDSEEFKVNAICNESKDIEEFNEIESTQLTPDMGDINIDERNVLSETDITDPIIKESISKVNNWLREKPVVTVSEKSKSAMVYLGPLTYKRKDSLTCKSPSEVTGKKVPKAAEYKPSSYAEELHKKYSEKSKTIMPTPTLNIWEKLEADLKKKDFEVKNRKKKG